MVGITCGFQIEARDYFIKRKNKWLIPKQF